jgi:hypothetical protein
MFNSVCNVPENSDYLYVAVNFTICGPKLPASSFSTYKLAFVVFLKLDGLFEERNLSPPSCEANTWFLLEVSTHSAAYRQVMSVNSIKQCMIEIIYQSLYLTYNLQRKWNELNM